MSVKGGEFGLLVECIEFRVGDFQVKGRIQVLGFRAKGFMVANVGSRVFSSEATS